MGDAKRKAKQQETRRPALEAAAAAVGCALRKLARAASGSLGGDCYIHAHLGAVLLGDLGFSATPVVGYAAWRVGAGDGDVVSHTPYTQGYVPEGMKGFSYHAWLVCEGFVVDFTTYQLAQKAAELDAADGGHTQVDWFPDLLVLAPQEILPYRAVAQAPGPGVCFYEAHPELLTTLQARFEPDPEDVEAARLLLRNPDVVVMGPNSLPV